MVMNGFFEQFVCEGSHEVMILPRSGVEVYRRNNITDTSGMHFILRLSCYSIDNTHLSAHDVAQRIVDAFGFDAI